MANTRKVKKGDSLWSIARSEIGGNPTNADLLAATEKLHRANREKIGADPGRIYAGTVLDVSSLHPPAPTTPSTKQRKQRDTTVKGQTWGLRNWFG